MLTIIMDEVSEEDMIEYGQAPYPEDNFATLGFRLGGPYYYATCDNYFKYISMYNALIDAEEVKGAQKVKVTEKSWKALDDMYKKYKKNKSGQYILRIPKTTQKDVIHFFLTNRRKRSIPNVVLYPVIYNGGIRLMAWEEGQPAVKRLLKIIGKRPVVRWKKSDTGFLFRAVSYTHLTLPTILLV